MQIFSGPKTLSFCGLAIWGLLIAGGVQANDLGELETALVGYQQRVVQVKFDGVVEAVNRATISAQTSGRVEEINFDVDDFVPKGSVIMRLRNEEQRAQLAAAEASLEEARAINTRSKAEHQRVKEVFAKKLVAKSALDQAVADLRASEERLKAAVARKEQAAEQLGYTVIRAPYSGIVVERHIEVGEVATVGKPLISGFAVDDMRVAATVPQDVIDQVRANHSARVVLDRPRLQQVESQEITFYPYADPATHTFKVRVGLPSGMEGVYPGMMTKVAFSLGDERKLLMDPRAVVSRSEVNGVYVVAGDTISYRQVRLGKRYDDGMVEVLAGVRADELVALDPVKAGIMLKATRAGN